MTGIVDRAADPVDRTKRRSDGWVIADREVQMDIQ